MRQHTRGWKNGYGGHEVDPRLGSSDRSFVWRCRHHGGGQRQRQRHATGLRQRLRAGCRRVRAHAGRKVPGSKLSSTLAPLSQAGPRGTDLYIQTANFLTQFAADLPAARALLMATTQQPVTDAALAEWTRVPSAEYTAKFLFEALHSASTANALGWAEVNYVSHVAATIMSPQPPRSAESIFPMATRSRWRP